MREPRPPIVPYCTLPCEILLHSLLTWEALKHSVHIVPAPCITALHCTVLVNCCERHSVYCSVLCAYVLFTRKYLLAMQCMDGSYCTVHCYITPITLYIAQYCKVARAPQLSPH